MADWKVGLRIVVNTPGLYFHGRHGKILTIDEGLQYGTDGEMVGTIQVQIDNTIYKCRFNPHELQEEK